MRKAWTIIKFVFYVLLAAAAFVALVMSFFETPDVPEFVWNMPRVY